MNNKIVESGLNKNNVGTMGGLEVLNCLERSRQDIGFIISLDNNQNANFTSTRSDV